MDQEKLKIIAEELGVSVEELTTEKLKKGIAAAQKADVRAREAKLRRVKQQLFIAYWHNGCPKCEHTYRPTQDEIKAAMSVREASGVEL